VVPVNAAVWDHIFASDKSWGLKTIKIDHLFEAFLGHARGNSSLATDTGVHAQLLSDPFAAHDFLGGIADAAARHDTDIMWCMSYPNVLMHSVQYPAATHARASSDSHPGSDNWRGFGGESMFVWAVGLFPFKDTFYTNTSFGQNLPLNGQDKGGQEHQPYTHTVIAALGGGGVAPGDVIGGSDVPLLMSTCRQDGALLKPTTPSAFIDRYWTQTSHPAAAKQQTYQVALQTCSTSDQQQWQLDSHGMLQSLWAKSCMNLPKCKPANIVQFGALQSNLRAVDS
jgi:hypothetical protein